MTTPPNKPFHITIGASSQGQSFENDIKLVKSALLYADKIKLCSLMASEAFRYLKIADARVPEDKLIFLEAYAREFIEGEEAERFLHVINEFKNSLSQKKHLTRHDLLKKQNLASLINKAFLQIKPELKKLLEPYGITPIIPLTESGVLEIQSLDNLNSFDYKKATKNFFDLLIDSISNQETYPLLDDMAGDLVRLGIKEGVANVSLSGISRGKITSLTSNLLERLPLFDEAEIDEILDIKKELERPLVRFRSSMMTFSEGIKNAPWDKDFSYDAETVFRRDVEPAILDIEDSVKSNSYLSSLTRKIADKPLMLPAGSALGLLLSPLSELPQVITATSLGAVASAGLLAYDAYKKWKQNNTKIEQNGLFFYYKTKERFSKLK